MPRRWQELQKRINFPEEPLHVYQKRLIQAAMLIATLLFTGTIGYYIVEEDWTLLDSFYMTVITLTTVGYGETHELTANGRIFTILLLLVSMTTLGYAISTIASFVIEGQLNNLLRGHRMDKAISRLNEHIIVCGGGRTGRPIVNEFYKTHTPFIVIELNDNVLYDLKHIGNIPYIEGDATEDEVLLDAGIERARGLIAALGDDKDNVFIVLTARALNPSLRIIARCNEEENQEKIRKAGANEIVSPNAIGGLRMASTMIRPSVVAFLDEMMRVTGETLRFEEIPVSSIASLKDKTLAQANIGQRTGLLVVAIRTERGDHTFNPGGKTVLQNGDTLIVLGTREQITHLHDVLVSPMQDHTVSNIFGRINKDDEE